MSELNVNNTLIIIIDVQERLLNAVFNKETCSSKAEIIAKTASILGIPVIVTEQYPKGLGETISQVKTALGGNAEYFEKTAFSALENKDILETIKNTGKKQIVIFGIETHICVSQTAAALIRNGYEVNIIQDACGSRAKSEYLAGLERMKDNGAHILTTEIALFEWLKSAKHPNFKEIQNLIK